MGRPKGSFKIPSYRLHKPSGRAVVTIDHRDVPLGKHGTPESYELYRRAIAELASGSRRTVIDEDPRTTLTVEELCARYWTHATNYYTVHALAMVRAALKMLRRTHASTLASEFGSAALKIVMNEMCGMKVTKRPHLTWSRKYVNGLTNVIREVFRWGVEEELVLPSHFASLKAVKLIRAGKSAARETARVGVVDDRDFEAVLPWVSPQVEAMLKLQRLAGMRSGEIVLMRACDIDMSGTVEVGGERVPMWHYKPMKHKTQHHGKKRVVPLGRQCQDIIRPFLKLDTTAFLFSPADADRDWFNKRRENGTIVEKRDRRQPGRVRKFKHDRYTTMTYWDQVTSGIRKADAHAKANGDERGVPHWWPHMLRHTAATNIRKHSGNIEAARVQLGHSRPSMTETYAEVDLTHAQRAMAEIG